MNYFFLVPRQRSLIISSNTRSIYYKVKSNLISIMSEIGRDKNKESVLAKTADIPDRPCTQFSLSVVANGACESNCLYVSSSAGRYLFNCGEGSQRLSSECGVKIQKADNVFVTSNSWNNIGGITGWALTIQQGGCKSLTVYGPPTIEKLLTATRSFIILDTLHIKIETKLSNIAYSDGNIKIQPVPIYPKSLNTDVIKQTNENEHEKPDSSNGNNNEMKYENKSENCDKNVYALCYICRTPMYGHHLDTNAALKKGVPCGPLFQLLKDHQDVILEDGTVVYWKDVVTGSTEPNFFIVVDCPEEDYLESLQNATEFHPFQFSTEHKIKAIVHFTPPQIMKTTQYMEWMSRFPPETKHLRINSDNFLLDHVEIYHAQMKLHLLYPNIFPTLRSCIPRVKEEYSDILLPNTSFCSWLDKDNEENTLKEGYKGEMHEKMAKEVLEYDVDTHSNMNGINVIKGLSTLTLPFHPQRAYDFRFKIALNYPRCRKEFHELVNSDDLEKFRKIVEEWENSEKYKTLAEYPKFLFLGTGSSVPHKMRNTAAILVHMDNENMILLDCGEGTYGQLLRFYGHEKLFEIFKKLKLIFISHHHADHHLGLINLLDARRKILTAMDPDYHENITRDLCILVPPPVYTWLFLQLRLRIISKNQVVQITNFRDNYEKNMNRLKSIGISDISFCRVEHCSFSYGVCITTTNGYKFTYSGDCKPSKSLIEAGLNSDLLIHEATFEEGLEKMANEKRHSTISQAIEVGVKMNAKFVMLTHFSQRYAHIPAWNNLPSNVGIAFDNMLVSEKELPMLPHLTALYKQLFVEKLGVLKERSLKRLRDAPRKEQKKMKMNDLFG